MINLVRGGRVPALVLLLAIFVYAGSASADTNTTLDIANDSLENIEVNNSVFNEVVNNSEVNNETVIVDKKDKKLVKTTASVKAKNVVAGSRGSFSATAYCLRGRTAMGHGVRRGIIAADPRVLRLGSTVSITSGAYAGSYLVSDTGGAIKGRKIDIWVPSCSEARRFGRRTVQVN